MLCFVLTRIQCNSNQDSIPLHYLALGRIFFVFIFLNKILCVLLHNCALMA